MAKALKVKFNVSGHDPEDAKTFGKTPKPNMVYPAKLKGFEEVEIKSGENKGGKQWKVTYALTVKEFANFPFFSYLPLDMDSVRADQFLQAIGEASEKKRTGEVDISKHLRRETPVRIRTRGGKDVEGNPRVEFGAVLPWVPDDDDEADESEEETEDEETEDEESEDEETDEEESDEEESEDEEEEAEEPSRREELEAMDRKELVKIAKSHNIKTSASRTEEDYITDILEAEGVDEQGEDEEEEAEEEGEEDEYPPYSEWSIEDLRAECKTRKLDSKGNKSALVARLEKYDEENPFTE